MIRLDCGAGITPHREPAGMPARLPSAGVLISADQRADAALRPDVVDGGSKTAAAPARPRGHGPGVASRRAGYPLPRACGRLAEIRGRLTGLVLPGRASFRPRRPCDDRQQVRRHRRTARSGAVPNLRGLRRALPVERRLSASGRVRRRHGCAPVGRHRRGRLPSRGRGALAAAQRVVPAVDRGSGAWLGARLVADYLDQLDGAASSPGSSACGCRWPERIGTDHEPILAWLRTARAADFATLAPAIVAAAGQDELAAALRPRRRGHVRLALALAPSPAAPWRSLRVASPASSAPTSARPLGAVTAAGGAACDPLHRCLAGRHGCRAARISGMPGNGGQP